MTDDRLAEQKIVVEKAANSKMLDKYSDVMLIGDNSKIIKAHTGELKNTHNAVFKKCLGKKECEHCGAKEPLAKQVLDKLHPNPKEPIDMKVFMKEFVMQHCEVGVWMLCKKCHRELG